MPLDTARDANEAWNAAHLHCRVSGPDQLPAGLGPEDNGLSFTDGDWLWTWNGHAYLKRRHP